MISKLQLVWVDSNINNYENQIYQKRLKQIINECSFINSTNEALKIVQNLQQRGDQIILIVSGSIIEETINFALSNNQIVFCGNFKVHFSKFLETKNLLVLIDSGISKVENYVKQNIEFLKAQQSLILQFHQKVNHQEQYSHQFQEISIKFLLINQKLQENYEDKEEQLNLEIGKLLSQEMLTTFQQSVKRKETLKIEKTKEKFNNFEKLIYYYTRDDQPISFYKILNQKLAQQKYEELEQIMCTIFYGYSNLKNQSLSTNKLYRGISFSLSQKDVYENIIEELKHCQRNNKSIFWNSLTSTTMKQSATSYFLQFQFKILFEISLSQVNPHPYFKLEDYNSEIPNEEEVILFPQFEFQVSGIYQNDKSFIIRINQVENNFAMALDVAKRKQYWENRINDDLKPKLQTITSFNQIRINQIMKKIRKFSLLDEDIRKILKTNTDDYFLKLVSQLQQFCDNQDVHVNYLSQVLSVIEQEFSFENSITDGFFQVSMNLFQKCKERLINEFIQIIKKIYNLEKFKNDIKRLIENSIKQSEIMRKKNEYNEDLDQVLLLSKEVDGCLFKILIDMFKKEKIQNCLKFLSKDCYKKHLEQYITDGAQSQSINKQKYKKIKNEIKFISNVIYIIKELDFNKNDYSTENYQENRKNLILSIQKEVQIIQFLRFLVLLTAIDNEFIQCGSNSLNLLVEMKVDLSKQCFENIKIKNTSLAGGNFFGCNLSGSEFNNVDISGINLNNALLFNCKWRDLKILELYKIDGHDDKVLSVYFSPDGSTLGSGSADHSIRLWNVKTGQQKGKLDGHTGTVHSICFSLDGFTLGSGSADTSIRLWDIKTGQQKAKLDGHTSIVYSVCFSPDGNILASGSDDNSIRAWDVNTGQQKAKLNGHRAVCFSPDNHTMAFSNEDNFIRLWDIKAEQENAQLGSHNNYVLSLCFSPDGTILASGSDDRSICLWDVQTKQQKAKLDGHTSTVYSVCFSTDGATLASGSADNSILLWDIKTGQEKAKLQGHAATVYSLCFSPDDTLASGSGDSYICLWDVKTVKQNKSLNGHDNYVLSVCFSPDGTSLASGSADSSICLWDVKTGIQKARLVGHSEWVQAVCFSPDGTILASGSDDKSICLWDIQALKQKGQLHGHTSSVSSVCFSPVGYTLASGSQDNSICLWDFNTKQQYGKLEGHTNYIQSIMFSPDGDTLASCGFDKSIRLWDVKTRYQKAKLEGHSGWIYTLSFSPDGTILASGSDDRSICLWDVQAKQQKAKLDGHTSTVYSVCFSTDGATLASGSADNYIRFWDIKTGLEKAKLVGHANTLYSVSFSPDAMILASGSADNTIRLWNVQSEYEKQNLDARRERCHQVTISPNQAMLASGSYDNSISLWDVKTGIQNAKLVGHSQQVQSLCFSPDSTLLASGSDDKQIFLWDVQIRQQKAKFYGHVSTVYSVCFSPDGSTLLSGSKDYSFYLWDVKTSQQRATLDCHKALCFSPDSNTLAYGIYDGSILLWNVIQSRQTAKLIGHTNYIQSLCFSPDGNRIASGSRDNSINLWHGKTGQLQAKLIGHSNWIYSICFSLDGSQLASGSYDNSIHLWDVRNRQLKVKLEGHNNCCSSLCFSSDSTTLASGSVDNSIRVWNLKTGEQLKPSDKSYKNILPWFQAQLNNNFTTNTTVLCISQSLQFSVNGTFILQGEFFNHQGNDLRQLFKQKGCYIFESQIELQKKASQTCIMS
ncbi:unnamed protein product (macronuclear) [Paramecium tetraurelia]|uniref:Uncharacterized protein n=1 Tax=Paramecium tetraurelia TaxID=5888 RepID=A0CVT5_PARTE|nr:uncharacterized protein GSPATT00039063001 [Paramecium tetraurelia]CAK74902.1 unnamed protein product [Paramecium tetraurelia]|eukprot:XP_001442299.1 hypothetical protein (macronuclear) [Paramecium tetraurelia strain d4-2]